MSDLFAYVGRQAIFTRELKVAAYELLYRDSMENRAKFSDVNQASASTMVNAFVDLGLESLVGELPVYVNLPAAFLLGRYPIPWDPARVVLEVLEDVPVTDELVDALRGFKSRGYTIALDDFELTDKTRALLPLADVIKIDVLGKTHEQVAGEVAALRPTHAKLLAEKVSTQEEMTFFRTLDFDYYQGFFLEMPIVTRGRRLPHQRTTLIQILAKLYDPRLDIRALERLLAGDVGLTVRLLRLASSAALSRGTPVGTIAQAVQRLGTQQLAALVLIIMVSGFDDKPAELITQSLVRARMCELVSTRTHLATPEQLFTAGLLSLLDAMLDQPLPELVKQLPLTQMIKDALFGNGHGASILAAARAQDRCDFDAIAATGLPAEVVTESWREAVSWARGLIALL